MVYRFLMFYIPTLGIYKIFLEYYPQKEKKWVVATIFFLYTQNFLIFLGNHQKTQVFWVVGENFSIYTHKENSCQKQPSERGNIKPTFQS